MSLNIIGIVFMCVGWFLSKRATGATSDASPDNSGQTSDSPTYAKLSRVFVVIGCVLTLISVLTGL